MSELRFTTLLDWLEGRLDEEDARRVELAVADASAETRETVDWIREFLGASRTMPLAAPPADLSERLRGSFDALHGTTGLSSDAELRFDSRLTPAAGTRSAASATALHLVFDSEIGRITLWIDLTAGPGLEIRGRLDTGEPRVAADLSLETQGRLRRAARCDRDGSFAWNDVPADVDELCVSRDGHRVRVPLSLESLG